MKIITKKCIYFNYFIFESLLHTEAMCSPTRQLTFWSWNNNFPLISSSPVKNAHGLVFSTRSLLLVENTSLKQLHNLKEEIGSRCKRLSSLWEDRSKTRRQRCDLEEWEEGRAETDVTCFLKRWVFNPLRYIGSDYAVLNGMGRSPLHWETRGNKVEAALRQFTVGKEELSSR